MSFNGTFYVLSPDAEEKYTFESNEDYANGWLNKKSQDEGRGLFAIEYKPLSGELNLRISDLLKSEKPFLKESLYGLVASQKLREEEFKSLLDKYSENKSEGTVLTNQTFEMSAEEKSDLSNQIVKDVESHTLNVLVDKATDLTLKAIDSERVAMDIANREALESAKESLERYALTLSNIEARCKVLLEEKESLHGENLKLVSENSALLKVTISQSEFLKKMDDRVNAEDGNSPEDNVSRDDVKEILAEILKEEPTESGPDESKDYITTVEAEDMLSGMIEEKIKELSSPSDIGDIRDMALEVLNDLPDIPEALN